MKRCHHPQENVRARDFDKEKCWVDAYCDNCGQGWLGFGYPWRSESGKLYKPPAWVLLLVKFKETVGA